MLIVPFFAACFRSYPSLPNICNTIIYTHLTEVDAKNKQNLFCTAIFWPVGLYWWMGLSHFRCRALHMPLLNFMRFLPVRFCSLSRSFWTAALPFHVVSSSTVFTKVTVWYWLQCWSLRDAAAVWLPVGLGALDCRRLGLVVQPIVCLLYSTYPNLFFPCWLRRAADCGSWCQSLC